MTNKKEVDYHAIVFDTETHDRVHPRIVSAAYAPVDEQGQANMDEAFYNIYNPRTPIALGAMAVHLISDEQVADKPSYLEFSLPSQTQYVIGHNVTFDLQAAKAPDVLKGICTLALSRGIWPHLGEYSQGAVFLHVCRMRNIPIEWALETLKDAHNALADIQMCSAIFQAQVAWFNDNKDKLTDYLDTDASIFESMHELTKATQLPMKMPFGKHAGQAPWNLPESYIKWYCNLDDADPGVMAAMKQGKTDNPDDERLFQLAFLLHEIKHEVDIEVAGKSDRRAQPSLRF